MVGVLNPIQACIAVGVGIEGISRVIAVDFGAIEQFVIIRIRIVGIGEGVVHLVPILEQILVVIKNGVNL
ncbi:MAG: hypothetical protein ACD_62C00430G0001 [uncultured bacterium]|nr:MAG: hypothetical protein ACD_62C00430G0001 [uncultured bacterium]